MFIKRDDEQIQAGSQPQPLRGWHFVRNDGCLGYNDGRKVEVGTTYTVDCEPVLCKSGLHWSTRLLDALKYAPGSILCRVESVEGHVVVEGDDKCVSTARKVIAMKQADDLLVELSRLFAAKVFWKHFKREDYPDIVKWLDEGDVSFRSAAERATYSAARNAAESAAYNAASSAAWAASGAAESTARSAAYAAYNAASSAAWAAYSAAESTARSAACSAASSAACAACSAASSAAWAASGAAESTARSAAYNAAESAAYEEMNTIAEKKAMLFLGLSE
jgi:hypothetical protein